MSNEGFRAKPLIERLEVAAGAYGGSACKAQQKGDEDAASWFRQHSRDVYEAMRELNRLVAKVAHLQMERAECEHIFRYQSIVYKDDQRSLPGSSAKPRQYFDRYFCEKCLLVRDNNGRYHGTSYDQPLVGSSPA